MVASLNAVFEICIFFEYLFLQFRASDVGNLPINSNLLLLLLLLLSFYQLHARYLQLYTWNKPCLYGIQCCRCSVSTVCTTCNVISPVKYVSYLYIGTSCSMCAVPNMAVFVVPWFCAFPVRCPGTVWVILKRF